MDDPLTTIANVAAILTAIIAVAFYVGECCRRHRNRQKVEKFLKRVLEKNAPRGGEGLRTVLLLMSKLGLTEDEVLRATFENPKIRRRVAKDPTTNRAEALLFGYTETPEPDEIE